MSKSQKFLLSSLLLHALLLLTYRLWPSIAPVTGQLDQRVAFEILPVRTESAPTTAASSSVPRGHLHGGSSSSSAAGSKTNKASSSTTVSDLNGYLPAYHFNSNNTDVNGDTYASNPLRDNANAEWGSGGGTFARLVDSTFFRELYAQIDNSLYYPGVLSRHKVTGTVNARIVFNDVGSCDWQKTKIQGSNAYLGLYVMDVLKSVCRSNFKRYLAKRELTNADFSFAFDMNESDDADLVQAKKGIVGNTLLFYRNKQSSIAEWEIGTFKGLFPVPAVYLNLPWIQENWDKLVNKKDPMKEFQREFGEAT